MKTLIRTRLLPAYTSILLCSSMAWGQQGYRPDETEFDPGPRTYSHAEKKQRSLFHRPEKSTAADQLAFAAAQEKEGRFRTAKDAYDDLVHHWHDSREAPEAQLALARVLFKQAKYEKAFKAFQYLVDHYAGRFQYNEVLDYQHRIANQIMNDRWGDVLFMPGFEAPERALPLLNQIVVNGPNWDKAPGVRLTVGMIHEELKDYESAVTAYDAVEQHHARSPEAETAAFRKAHCLYILSEKTPRDEKRCRRALSAMASFLARHKQSPDRAEAEIYLAELKVRLAEMYYERALYYDEIVRRPASALIAYRDFLKKFPASDRAEAVFTRIEALEREVEE
jgi:outer membrane protein assembly factor BamD (BamD/ComL family)